MADITVVKTSIGPKGDSANVITGDITKQIPTDYATLQAAIDDLSSNVIAHGVTITLNIESGTTITSQLLLSGGDYSQFRITSTDAEVTISRSDMTDNLPSLGTGRTPAFGIEFGFLPVIDALFAFDGSGTTSGVDGILLVHGSRAFVTSGSGVKNAGDRGLFATFASQASARSAVFTGAGNDGVRFSGGSFGDVNGVDCSNATDVGIRSVNGSAVEANSAVAKNCGAQGAHAADGAIMNAQSINTDGSNIGVLTRHGGILSVFSATLTNAGDRGAFAQHGGYIAARQADTTGSTNAGFEVANGSTMDTTGATGSLSQTANLPTQEGIIYNDQVTRNAGTQTFSGDGSTATFDVTHGLSVAPTVKNVWAESADADGNKRITTVTSNVIRVVFASAPPSGTDNVVLGFHAEV